MSKPFSFGIGIVVAGVIIVASVFLADEDPGIIGKSSLSRTASPALTGITNRSVSPSPRLTEAFSPKPSGKKVLAVPFSVQAPTANWDPVHEETCEEVAVIMAYAWVKGVTLYPALVEQEIQKTIKWQMDSFGFFADTSARQTAQMAESLYGLETGIIENPTVQKIKDEIDAGRIVIAGVAGRMLGNPYYTPPGPLYHMLLIKGYDATGFITNDDGTRRGESYHYSYPVIMAAFHDWNGSAETLSVSPAVAFTVSKD